MTHNGISPLVFLAMLDLTPERLIGMIVVFPLIALSLTVHEFWHAYSADLMGDATGRMQGRCTLNPLDGHHLFRAMLQGEAKQRYIESQRFGIYVLILLVLFGRSILNQIILRPGERILELIAGTKAISLFAVSEYALGPYFGLK